MNAVSTTGRHPSGKPRRATPKRVLLAVAVAFATFVAPGIQGTAMAAACPSMHVIGVRGSNEQVKFGPTIDALVKRTKKLNNDIDSDWVDYPAVIFQNPFTIGYDDSVAEGEAVLADKIFSYIHSPCGASTYIYLAGYSQGAHVVANVFQHKLLTSERERIGGVVLFGDPLFGDTPVASGDYDPHRYGILVDGHPASTGLPQRDFLVDDNPIVRSYCQLHDAICNYTAPDAAALAKKSSAHYHYMDRTYLGLTYVERAADFLLSRWRKLGPFRFTQIAAGFMHECGIRKGDGATLCWWGLHDAEVSPPPHENFMQLTAGGVHTCGLRADQTVLCWGSPEQTGAPSAKFKQISAGAYHTCGIRKDGGVTCWGSNTDGELERPFGQLQTGVRRDRIHVWCAQRQDGGLLGLSGLGRSIASARRLQAGGGRWRAFLRHSRRRNHRLLGRAVRI